MNKSCKIRLLFTYHTISRLAKNRKESQAIKQPLEMTIPESSIMPTIYLATPEVENDRRSLNTIAAMRKVMKKGGHVSITPKRSSQCKG